MVAYSPEAFTFARPSLMAFSRSGLVLATAMPYCSPVGISWMIFRPRDVSLTMAALTGRSLTTASTLPACRAEKAARVSSKATSTAPLMFSLAHAWPVVPDWRPIFLPARSVALLAEELFLTAIDWLESMYGSEKSISFLRSSLIVMPDMMMSNLPPAFSVGIRVSNLYDLNSDVRPACLAMAAARSTSKPSAVLPFIDSNGGNAVSEPTMSLPGSTVLRVVAAGVPGVGAGVLVHPLMPPMPTTIASVRSRTSHLLALRMFLLLERVRMVSRVTHR